MLLIQHGPLEWDGLSEAEQKRVTADYQAVSATADTCSTRRTTSTPRSSWRRAFRRCGSAEPSRCGR